jgi:4-hydroxy-tetrahydrodipicolinate synthase
MPLHRAAFAEPNPAPAKFALSLLGKCTEEVRSPMVPVEEPAREKMRAAMRHAGLLN